MDNYSGLLKDMADAFITAVRVLETENAQLRSENELLRIELDETHAQADYWEEFMAMEQERDREAWS